MSFNEQVRLSVEMIMNVKLRVNLIFIMQYQK